MSYMNTLPWKQENVYLRDAFLILLSSLLITLMGQFSIPLPFTPVPISFRMQTIFFLAVLLGSRRAAMATFLFLVQGAVGLPIFAGGASGIIGLLGPSGGYYAGFVLAAFVIGNMTEKYKARPFMAFFTGTLIVYLTGSAYLASFVGMQKAFLLGVVPFLFGDLFKSLVCLKMLDWMKR